MRHVSLLPFFLLFFSLPFIHCHNPHSQKRDISKYIIWHKNLRLKWSDYKEEIPWEEPHAAESYIWSDFSKKEFGDYIIVNLTTYFVPDSSWYNPIKINNRVLDHEIRHVDIAEVFNRRFRKYLQDWKGRDYEDLMSYFHNGQIEQQALALQAQYDSETNHSVNILIQKQWDKKIDSLLDVYKDFAAPQFRIQMNSSVK
jgi:hypothetical protein